MIKGPTATRFFSILLFLALVGAVSAYAQNNWIGGTNNWNGNTAFWSLGHLPAVGEDVTINAGNCTLTAGTTVNSLSIGGGTFTVNAPGFTTNAGLSMTSGSIVSVGSRTLTIKGNVSMSGGTVDPNITIAMASTGSPSLGSTVTLGSLNVNVTGTASLTGTLTLATNMSLTNGTLSAAGFNIFVAGNWTKGAGAFTAGAGTVTFNGAGTQTITGVMNGASSFGSVAISGPANIVDFQSNTFTIGSLSNGGILALDGVAGQSTASITSGANTSGTIRYKGATGGTVYFTSVYNLDINSAGQTFVLNAGTTVAGNLSVTLGTLNTGNNTLAVTGNASITGTLGYTATTQPLTWPPPYSVTGTTTINTGGTLNTGNNSMNLAGGLVLSGGTFNFSGATNTNASVDVGPISATAPSIFNGGAPGVGTVRSVGTVNLTNITYTPGQTRWTLCGTSSFTSAGQQLAGVFIGSSVRGIGTITLLDNMNITGNAGATGLASHFAGSSIIISNRTITLASAGAGGGDIDCTAAPGAALTITSSGGSTLVFNGTHTLKSNGNTLDSITVGGGGSLTLGDNLALRGNVSNSGTLDATTNLTLVTFNSGATQSVTGTTTWQDLTISGASTVVDFAGNNFTINGTFTNGGTLAYHGDAAQTANFTVDTANGTIRYNGTLANCTLGQTAFNNLEINGGAGGVFVTVGNTTTNGNVTLVKGSLQLAVGNSLTIGVSGTPMNLVFSGGILDLSVLTGTTNIEVWGTIGPGSGQIKATNAGRFRAHANVDLTGITYTGGGTTTWNFAGVSQFRSAGALIANLRISSPANINGSVKLMDNLTIAGNGGTGAIWDQNAGGTTATLDVSGVTVTIQNGPVNLSGINSFLIDTSSTFVFSGATTLTPSGFAFNNIQIGGSGALTLGGALTVNGSWTTNSGGTFSDAGAFGVTLDTSNPATITGSTSFNSLTLPTTAAGKVVTFTSGVPNTTTVSGTFIALGVSGNPISLLSSAQGSYWYLTLAGSPAAGNVQYVQVQDGNASVAVTPTVATSSDLGHNVNWNFGAGGSPQWSPTAAPYNWSNSKNWNLGYVPGLADTVTIPSTANPPSLNAKAFAKALTISTGSLDLVTFDLQVTNALTIGATGTLTLQGNQSVTVGSRSYLGSVVYNGTGTYTRLATDAANPASTSYGNLTFNGGGGGNWTLDTGPLVVTGTLTVAANNTLDVSSSNYGISVGGSWSNGGTFNPRSGTVTFNTATAASFSDSSTTFSTISLAKTGSSTFTATTALNAATLTVANNLFNIALNAGGTVTALTTFANTGTLAIPASFTFTNGVIATNPSSKSIGGTISSTNAQLSFGGNATTLSGNTILNSAGGNVSFAALDGTAAGAQSFTVNQGAGTMTFANTVGATTSLASVAVSGSGPITLRSVTTAAGGQTYAGPVTLGANATLTGNAATLVWLQGTVDAAFTFSVATANAEFDGLVGGTTPLTSLSVGGTTLINTTSITTSTGGQTYTGAVTLGANATLTGNAATLVSFGSTVNGGFTLGVATANGSFGGIVGGTTPLVSVSVAGTTAINTTAITTTTGGQTYTGAVTLGANATLTGNAATLVSFGSTVNGGFTLGVATANGSFGGIVGGTTPLVSVSVAGTTAINTTAITTTTGGQTYTGAVTLGANTTLTGNAATLVWFKSTLDGARTFAIATANGQFDGIVGTTALTSLSVGGTTLINTTSITTSTGGQTYTGAVTLGANATLTGNAATLVSFGSTVNGGFTLGVATANGSFGGIVGGTTPLVSVSVAGTTAINTTAITTTTGGQTYTGAVTLGANATLTGNAATLVWFKSTLDGARTFAIATANGQFDGIVGTTALTSLSVGGTTLINTTSITTTTGGQTYTGAVTLGANATLTGNAATLVSFGSTVNGGFTLGVATANGSFGGIVGGTTPLVSVSVAGTTAINTTAITTTTGGQTYTGAVTLGANATLTGNAATLVSFGSTVNGGFTLGVATANGSFGGIVGGTTPLVSVSVAGTTAINTTAITTTTGGQTYTGAVTLGANTTLTGNAATLVWFKSTLDGARTFAIATANGQFDGIVGTTALTSLSVGGTTLINTTSITTSTGGQTYTGAVTLGANATLTGNAATLVSFGSTVNGGFTLGVATANGSFGGIVGGTTPLVSVSVAGTTAINTTAITTTTGGQTYTGAVTLGANTTLTGNAATLVWFKSTLDGARTFAIATANGQFDGIVGTTALTSLSVGGTTLINTTSITTTTGGQTYTGAVTLGANATLTGNAATLVWFKSTLDGARTFAIATANGQFDGIVGTTALTSLSVGGTTLINTTSITTSTGGQTYTGAVTLGANATLTGNAATLVSFGSTVNGGFTLGVATANGSFGGIVGGTTPLVSVSVAGTTAINTTAITTTTGGQTYTGAVTLGANATLTGNAATLVWFKSTLDGARTFAIATANGQFDGIVGTTALTSLSVGGTTLINTTSITTSTGGQTYTGAVTLGANATLTGNAATLVSFGSTVNGGFTLGVATANGSFGGIVGGTTPLVSVSVAGTTAINTTAITTTTGGQTYTGAVTLGANATLTGNAATLVSFGSTVNGGFTLGVATANGSFGGIVGGTTPLVSVSVAGTTAINTTAITTTTGGQTYTGAVTLGANTTLTGNAATLVWFKSTLDGARTFAIATANGQFDGIVGTTALTSLSVGGTTLINTTSITTSTGGQTYTGAVTLGANTTLTGNLGTLVWFKSTLDGGFTFAVASANARFDGTVGTTALTSLTVAGTTAINAAGVTTGGGQTYTGAVTLGATAALSTTNSPVLFSSTVDGTVAATQGLSVSVGTGTATFVGVVGGSVSLASLGVVSSSGAANAIQLQSVTTDTALGGTQTYGAPITLEADTVLTGYSGSFASAITGAGHNLTLDFTSTTALTTGDLVTVGSLTSNGPIQLSGTITTTGSQTYNGTVQLIGDTTLNTTNSAVSFGSTVDGNAVGRQLTIAVGTSSASFAGTVGAGSALGAVSITSNAISFNGGANSVHGNSTILLQPATAGTSVGVAGGAGTLVVTAADVAALASGFTQIQVGQPLGTAAVTVGAAGVTFTSPALLQSNGAGGSVVLDGSVATGTNAATFTAASIDLNFAGGNVVSTTGTGMTFNGPVLLTSNATLASAGGNVLFNSTVDSISTTPFALTVNKAAGTLTFTSVVGVTHALDKVATDAGGSVALNTTAINTAAGGQAYGGPVALGSNVTLTGNAATLVSFGSSVNGAFTLAVATANGSFGGIVGGTTPLVSVSVAGTTAINTTAITTSTGGQTYTGAVTLGANTTLTGNAATLVWFKSTLDGGFTFAVATANARFDGVVGTTALTSLSVAGTTAINTTAITTSTGGQTYTGAVTLGANLTLTGNAATLVSFGGTVNGAFTLAVATANGSFGGIVGGTTPLVSVSVAGTTAINTTAITTTTGGQTYTGAVTLGANTTLTGNAATLVWFKSTLDGGFTFAVATANARFDGVVGTTALTSLSVAGTTAINTTAITTSTGGQTYTGAVTLGANTTLTGNAATLVWFKSTLDGGFTFAVATANARFDGVVGTTALTSLSVAGTTAINTTAITTSTGGQTYTGAVTLGANLTLTGNAATLVSFGGTVNGAFTLAVATANGSFGGIVGGTTPLVSVSVAGTTAINTTAITTSTGGQTYTGAVTLGANTTLTGNAATLVWFKSTLDGGFTFAVATANARFDGVVGTTALTSLSVAGTTAINTTAITTSTGGQTYTGAVTLGANLTLTGNAATLVWFKSTLDGGFTFAVATANARFDGVVGTTALTSLSVAGTTAINTTAITTSTGGQTYTGAVTLGANTTLTGNAATLVWFKSTLDGGFTFAVATANARFDGVVGTTALTSLSVAGTTAINTTAITTSTGGQTYTGAVTLGANTTLTGNAATLVWFKSTLDGGFTFAVATANARFDGVVGTTALTSLSVAGTTAINTTAITTSTGGQTYTGAVTLGANTTLTGNAATLVWFKSTLDGGFTFAVATANARFDGVVGTTALTSLSVAGTTAINTTAITTSTGGQTYTGAVTLGANTTLTGNAATLVWFKSTLDGGFTFAVATANARFDGVVGTTALTSLSVAGTTAINTTAITTSTGGQTYTGAVTLGANLTLTGNAATLVWFKSTLDGGFTFAVATANARFDGVVGTTALTSLSVAGTTAINTTAITTSTGGQTYTGAVTLGANLTLTGNAATLVWFKSTLDGAHTLHVATGNARFDSAVGTTALSSLTVDGSSAINAASIATTGGQTYSGAVTLGSSTTLNAGAGAITSAAVTSAGFNLGIANSGGATIASASLGAGTFDLTGVTGGTVTVSGALNAGALTTGAAAYNVVLDGGGTVGAAVTLSNTGTLTIPSGFAFTNGVTATSPSTSSIAGTISATANNISFGQTVVTANATLTPPIAGTISFGNLTINGGATLDPSNRNVFVGGNWTDNGAYTAASETVTFNGSTPQGLNAGGSSFANIAFSSSNTVTLGSAIVVTGNLSITGGGLDVGANRQITVGGNWNRSAGAFTPQNGLVVFNASGAIQSAETFFDLTKATAATTTTLQADIVVSRDFSITGGTLNGNGHMITVSRNWANADTYTAGATGTVQFVSAGTTSNITGTTTFQNLSCTAWGKDIVFEGLKTQTVNGTFTITGLINNLISLTSSSSPNQWTLALSGPQSVTYAFVQDGSVTGNAITANTSRDNGNNSISPLPPAPGWYFTFTAMVWTGATDFHWNTKTNWTRGYVPNITDSVAVNAGAPVYPLLDTDTTIIDLTITGGGAGATVGLNNHNLTLTGNLAVSGVGSQLNASGTETLMVTGNVTFGAGSTFTKASSTLTLVGLNTTITAPPAQATFYNLTLSKSGAVNTLQLLSDVTTASGVGSLLTVTTGTILLNGHVLTVANPLNLASANGTIHLDVDASALSLGTNALTVSAGTLLHDAAATTMAVTAGSLTVSGSGTYTGTGAGALTLTPGGISVTGGSLALGAKTVTTVGLTQNGGTILANTSTISSSGNVAITAGTFTEGTSLLTMTAGPTTLRVVGPNQLHDLTVASGAGVVSISTSPLIVANNLVLTSGTFSTAGNALTVGVSPGAGGTGNISANVGAAGVLQTTGAETVTVYGNIDFSGTGNNLTQAAGSFIVLAGGVNTTVNAPQESFGGTVTVNKTGGAVSVTLASNMTFTNNTGVLTMTQGTVDLAGFTLRLGTNLGMSSASPTTLIIGTGTLDGGTNAKTVSVTNASATITQSTGTLSASGLSVSAGAYTLSGAGTVTVGAGGTAVSGGTVTLNAAAVTTVGLTQNGGTILANTSTISSSGNVAITAGTFTEGTSLLTMTAGPTTLRVVGPNQLHDLTVASGAGVVSISTSPLIVANNLVLTSGTFSTAGNALTVGVSPGAGGTGNISANVGAAGVLQTTGAETVTVYGNIDFSGTGNNLTQAAGSFIVLAGGVNTTVNAPQESFGGTVTVNKTGGAVSVTLASNMTFTNNTGVLTMTQGTVDLAGFTLRLGTNLGMSSASPTTLIIGTGTLDGGTNSKTVSVTNASATITQSTGTLSASGLSVSAGAYTLSGAGTVTVGAGGTAVSGGTVTLNAAAVTTVGLTQNGGTILANTSTISSSGNVAITAGTFTEGTSLLTMTAGPTTLRVVGPNQLHDLTVASGAGVVSISTSPLIVANNLVLTSGTFSTAGNALTVGVSPGAGGTGNISANVGAAGVLQTTGAETVTVYGNIDFSGTGNNLAQAAGSFIVLAGGVNTTVNAPQESFAGTVTIGKTGPAVTVTLASNMTFTNNTGVLTMTQGTVDLAGFTLRLGTNLGMSSASPTTLIIGTGTLDGGTNSKTVSVTNASATITQSTGTLSASGLSVSAGAYTLSGAGTVTVGAGGTAVSGGTVTLNAAAVTTVGLTQNGGTILANTSTISSSGNVAITAGTFTEGTSLLTMTAGPTTLRVVGPNQLHDLTVASGAGVVSISTSPLIVANNLVLTSGTFSTAGNALTVGVSPGAGGTGNISANVGAAGVLQTTGAETVTVYGNIDFSGTGNNLTQAAGSFIVLAGGVNTTVNAPQESFAGTVTIGKTGPAVTVTLASNMTFTSGTGTLLINQGMLVLPGFTLRLGTALTLGSGGTTLSIGTGTVDGATNSSVVSITAAGATITQTTGTLSASALDISAGAYTLSGAGTVTVGAGGLNVSGTGALTLNAGVMTTGAVTQTGGTILANTSSITTSGNVAITAGTFTEGTSLLTMTGAGTTVQVTGPRQLHDLTIGAAANVTISTSDLAVGNNLSILGTFGTNNNNLTVGGNLTVSGTLNGSASPKTIVVTGSTTASGTINLDNGDFTTGNLTVSGVAPAGLVASASEFITVNGSLDFSAAGNNYTPMTSTIVMGGAATPVTINAPPAEDPFYELTINKGGVLGNTVTLLSDIRILHSTTITSGTLSAGTHAIAMQGVIWDNVGSKTGIGFFNPGTGTVTFTNSLLIKGNNTWFNFTCVTDSVTIQFEHLWTQTILAGGNFHVQASSPAPASLITLTTDLVSIAANGAPPPALVGQWVINNMSAVAQTIDNVNVSFSYALISITPGPGAVDGGNNFNWNFVIPIVASWTLDTTNNGRIDRIRVQVKPGTQLSNNFVPGHFDVAVDGYAVAGYQAVGLPANTDVFDVLLTEGPAEDTGAILTWRVLDNAGTPAQTLYGLVGGALVDHDPNKIYTTASGARPVITYTAAAVGSTKVYVHFSALAYGDAAGGPLPPTGTGILAYTDGSNPIVSIVPVEKVGNGAHAAVVTLTNPIKSTDVFPSPFFISAVAGKIWGQSYPNKFFYPTALVTGTVNPAQQTSSDGDPGSAVPPYLHTNPDGNLPGGGTSAPTTAHNVSDVGLNFVTPVFALDRDINRDPANGGIGLVTVFDGSKWLPPANTMIEARVMVPAYNNAAITMYWDTNPPPALDFRNLWVPNTATTLWQSAGPNGPGDRAHYPGYNGAVGPVAPSSVNGPLRDYMVSGSSPAIKDGSRFQFVFTLDDGLGHILPCAFPDPNDPSVVHPFEYDLHSLVQQRGQVTITNNVINPTAGQVAHVQYVMQKSGAVTITVFDLSGSIVNVLARGTQAAGSYTTSWDGKNRNGAPVARGIYFIRVVGPDFDEIRKVLVVR